VLLQEQEQQQVQLFQQQVQLVDQLKLLCYKLRMRRQGQVKAMFSFKNLLFFVKNYRYTNILLKYTNINNKISEKITIS
jgi:hypothetical protein